MTSREAADGLPFALSDGVRLRLLEANDGPALARAYTANAEHLAPWEPVRDISFFTAQGQQVLVDASMGEQQAQRSIHFVLESDGGRIVGCVNLNNIVRGAFHSANLGYWVDASLAGRGIMSAAVGRVIDFCRDDLGLHRLQAATLLHNAASQRVLAGNGFEQIGMAARYLRIAGEWQDHLLFQRILTDD